MKKVGLKSMIYSSNTAWSSLHQVPISCRKYSQNYTEIYNSHKLEQEYVFNAFLSPPSTFPFLNKIMEILLPRAVFSRERIILRFCFYYSTQTLLSFFL